MNDALPPPVALALVGPTASGKTALAIEVARRLGGEIISMDSRQVYRGMDIGTAKATAEERRMVPHHGLDLVDPDERFGAGRFARFARNAVREIRARGKVPLLVGGTGFFLRALTHPIFREPDLEPARRAALHSFLDGLDSAELQRWLGRLDPPLAARFAQGGGGGGRQRIQRALEMSLLTGRPLSWWQQHGEPEAPPLPVRIYRLDPPRAVLDRAIDLRVEDMVRGGLEGEVRSLLDAGFKPGDPGMNATGYIEMVPVVRGEIPLETALERIRANTRAYARRQVTWLRHQLPPDRVLVPREAEDPAGWIVDDWRGAKGAGDRMGVTATGEGSDNA